MGSVIMICTNSTDLYAKQPEKRGVACHQRALDRYVILHLVSTIIILLHLFIRGSKAHYITWQITTFAVQNCMSLHFYLIKKK